MKKKWLTFIVLAVLLAIGVAFAGTVYAQEESPELGCPPSCGDASLEVEVLAGCLIANEEGTIGYGVLKVRNTGEQGVVTITLQAFFTKGTGTVQPNEITLDLEPGEEWQTTFSVIPTETAPDGTVQIRWEIVAASCRPDHNIGKGANADFEGCPTAVELVKESFTASWSKVQPENKGPHWIAPLLGIGAIAGLVLGFVSSGKKRNP